MYVRAKHVWKQPETNLPDSAGPSAPESIQTNLRSSTSSNAPVFQSGSFFQENPNFNFNFLNQNRDKLFHLDWNVKNQLVKAFTDYSEEWHGLKLSKDAKNQLIKLSQNLIEKLQNLPAVPKSQTQCLWFDGQNLSMEPPFGEKLVCEISGETKCQIVKNLLDNQDCAILGDSTPETNNSILQDNKYLIQVLTDLNVLKCAKTSIDYEEENTNLVEENEIKNSNNFEKELKNLIRKEIRTILIEEESLDTFSKMFEKNKHKICSYSFTGRNYVNQASYHCETCNVDGRLGICSTCCFTCHSGHKLIKKVRTENFCDCGSDNIDCKSVVKFFD